MTWRLRTVLQSAWVWAGVSAVCALGPLVKCSGDGRAGSQAGSDFTLFGNLHRAWTNLRAHQQCRRLPPAPYPGQSLFEWQAAWQVKWRTIVVLVCFPDGWGVSLHVYSSLVLGGLRAVCPTHFISPEVYWTVSFSGVFFFFLNLYPSWILIFYRLYILRRCFPIPTADSSLDNCLLCCAKALEFHTTLFISFWHYLPNHCSPSQWASGYACILKWLPITAADFESLYYHLWPIWWLLLFF